MVRGGIMRDKLKVKLLAELLRLEDDSPKLEEIEKVLGIKEIKGVPFEEWRPFMGDMYYTLTFNFGRWEPDYFYYDGGEDDLSIIEAKLMFKTLEEAEYEANKRNFLLQMKVDFLENSDEINWLDSMQLKYCIIYDRVDDDLSYSTNYVRQLSPLVTTNKDWLEDYLIVFRDEIKEYYFGEKPL